MTPSREFGYLETSIPEGISCRDRNHGFCPPRIGFLALFFARPRLSVARIVIYGRRGR